MSAHDPQFGERRQRPVIHECAQDRHKDAVRIMGYAFVLGDLAGWTAATAIWAARLSVNERGAVAGAALLSLEPEQSEVVFRHCFDGAGYPLPSLFDPLADARMWAAAATRSELKAYALAAYEAMSSNDQSAFRRHLRGDGRVS